VKKRREALSSKSVLISVNLRFKNKKGFFSASSAVRRDWPQRHRGTEALRKTKKRILVKKEKDRLYLLCGESNTLGCRMLRKRTDIGVTQLPYEAMTCAISSSSWRNCSKNVKKFTNAFPVFGHRLAVTLFTNKELQIPHTTRLEVKFVNFAHLFSAGGGYIQKVTRCGYCAERLEYHNWRSGLRVKEMPRLKPRFSKLFIRWLIYWAGLLLLRVISELPQGLANFLCSRIALIGARVFRAGWRVALENLQVLENEYSQSERRAIAARMFANFGRSMAEFAGMPRWGRRHLLEIVDGSKYLSLIREGLRRGKGVIIAGGHIGNWEVLAAYTASFFPLSVVARRLYFEPFDRAVVGTRKRLGTKVIYQQDGIRPIVRALRGNKIIGILVDQDIKGVASEFVDFFGRKASTPTAHSALALSTGAAMYAAAIVRVGGSQRFKVLVEGPVEVERTGDKAADRLALTARWSELFENFIREYPDQWAWFHRRWKTPPPGGS